MAARQCARVRIYRSPLRTITLKCSTISEPPPGGRVTRKGGPRWSFFRRRHVPPAIAHVGRVSSRAHVPDPAEKNFSGEGPCSGRTRPPVGGGRRNIKRTLLPTAP